MLPNRFWHQRFSWPLWFSLCWEQHVNCSIHSSKSDLATLRLFLYPMDTERLGARKPPLEGFRTTFLFDGKTKPELLYLDLGELVTKVQYLFSASAEKPHIALTSTNWLLVRTPSVAARPRREFDNTFATRGLPISSFLSYELVKWLPYLRACVDGGLRLRPSLP